MTKTDLPPIQARRFDFETLDKNAFELAKQAAEGPTWIRQDGKIAFVLLSQDLFDRLWPDPRRAWGTHEAPEHDRLSAIAAIQELLSNSADE